MREKRELEFDKIINKIHEFYVVLESEPGHEDRNLVCSEAKSIEVLSQGTLDHIEKILQSLEVEKKSNMQRIADIIGQIRYISGTLNLPFQSKIEENCCSKRVIYELTVELNSLEEERKKHMAVFIRGKCKFCSI